MNGRIVNMESIPDRIMVKFLELLNKGDIYLLLFVDKRFAILVGNQKNRSIITEIIKFGSVDQLLWAKENKFFYYKSEICEIYDKSEICQIAALGGNLEILKYAHENGYHGMCGHVYMQLKVAIWTV